MSTIHLLGLTAGKTVTNVSWMLLFKGEISLFAHKHLLSV